MTKFTADARAIPDDAIDAEEAHIYWNLTDDAPKRVRDVTIVNRREVHEDPRIEAAWDCSGGAVYNQWLNPRSAIPELGTGGCELTPEGAFGRLLAIGYADPTEAHRAIYQFARIKDATWAQRMLRSLSQAQEDAVLAKLMLR